MRLGLARLAAPFQRGTAGTESAEGSSGGSTAIKGATHYFNSQRLEMMSGDD